jgi:hypothetical protein
MLAVSYLHYIIPTEQSERRTEDGIMRFILQTQKQTPTPREANIGAAQ